MLLELRLNWSDLGVISINGLRVSSMSLNGLAVETACVAILFRVTLACFFCVFVFC